MNTKVKTTWLITSIIMFAWVSTAWPVETLKELPKPVKKGPLSVEEALQSISTERAFSSTAMELSKVGQILWAANGSPDVDAKTSATKSFIPSAGGLYPIEVFLVAGKKGINDLEAGVYHYKSKEHALKEIVKGDKRYELAMAALGQSWLTKAPACVIIAGVFGRTLVKYGKRGVKYVYIEAGSANQNIYLQTRSLNINTAVVGAFNDKSLHKVLNLPKQVKPILIVALGNSKESQKASKDKASAKYEEKSDEKDKSKEKKAKPEETAEKKTEKKTDKDK